MGVQQLPHNRQAIRFVSSEPSHFERAAHFAARIGINRKRNDDPENVSKFAFVTRNRESVRQRELGCILESFSIR